MFIYLVIKVIKFTFFNLQTSKRLYEPPSNSQWEAVERKPTSSRNHCELRVQWRIFCFRSELCEFTNHVFGWPKLHFGRRRFGYVRSNWFVYVYWILSKNKKKLWMFTINLSWQNYMTLINNLKHLLSIFAYKF